MWEESALEGISPSFRLYRNLRCSDPGNGMERELELERGPANPRITRQPRPLQSPCSSIQTLWLFLQVLAEKHQK